MWIEMDKFLARRCRRRPEFVVYRPDTESSVVKRPVDDEPGRGSGRRVDPDEGSYCDCGWPYTLLLPRGTDGGMAFRLLVLCTDATIDQVPTQVTAAR